MGGAAGVVVRAVQAGLLMSRKQAGILLDLGRQRPIAEIEGSYGPGFEADVASLATMLEVEDVRPAGRLLQFAVSAAREEGLVTPRRWPDPVRSGAAYGRLLQERFGFGPEEAASLRALSSQSSARSAQARLSAMAVRLGEEAGVVQARVCSLGRGVLPRGAG